MIPRPVDVYNELLDQVVTWQLAPGMPLVEQELAARFSVSRTPVREALARLRRDGLVVQDPGQIAVVAAVDADSTIAVYQVRDALETYSVQLAAVSPARTRFVAIAAQYQEVAESMNAGDLTAGERLYTLSDDFNAALQAAVKNPYLLKLLDSTGAALLRLRHLARADSDRLHRAAELRAAEAQAIAKGAGARAGRLSHDRISESLQHALTVLLADPVAHYVPPPLIRHG